MKFTSEFLNTLSIEQFRRFGIALCHRLRCDQYDRRLAKALRKLEESLGPPLNEKLRRDAHNTASSAYNDIRGMHSDITLEASVACTLVCASEKMISPNLLGNFESALEKAESLSLAEIRKIEQQIFDEAVLTEKEIG